MLIAGIHPAGWAAVGAVALRQELLVGLFMSLAVYLHAKARRSGQKPAMILSAVSLLLALWSKETALFLIPLYITMFELTNRGKKGADSLKNRSLLAVEGVIMVAYVLLRMYAVPEIWAFNHPNIGIASAVGMRLSAVAAQTLSLLAPVRPGLSDAVPVSAVGILPLLGLIIIAAGGFTIAKKGLKNAWSMAILLTGISLLPVLNFIAQARFNSPLYSYIALPGAAALLVLAVRSLVATKTSRIAKIILAVWIAVGSLSTIAGGLAFQSDITLFSPQLKRDSHFREARYYLGNTMWNSGQFAAAQEQYEAAIMQDKNYLSYVDMGSILINYAGVLMQQNKLNEAAQVLTVAQKYLTTSNKPVIVYNLAIIAAKQGDYHKVAVLLGENNIQWQRPEPLLLLANALSLQNRRGDEIAALKKMLPLVGAGVREKIEKLIEAESTRK